MRRPRLSLAGAVLLSGPCLEGPAPDGRPRKSPVRPRRPGPGEQEALPPGGSEAARHESPEAALPGAPPAGEAAALREGAACALARPEARHGAAALRLAPGDPVELLGPCGIAPGTVLESAKGPPPRLTVRIDGPFAHEPGALPGSALALAVIRPQAFEWAAEKASELGCATLVPLVAARSRAQGQDAGGRLARRARAAARESQKQCGRAALMEVSDPMTTAAFLAGLEGRRHRAGDPADGLPEDAPCARLLADRSGVPVLKALADLPAAAFSEFPSASGGPAAGFAILVGPEGGFSPEERDQALRARFTPVSLSPHTLKSETAAVSLLAALSAFRLSRG
ncbi:MAG: 16S rRNA (uracil(1498)-N(3))-methyltransferase [Deltaproteobacteria bacterium]|jgi:16S rRNA (uracil1498-N3)-methyltransferase|nr:16S rRNA (uracil(1498)-N(3))-methyltransferase [Deltaproteobacteria bacterium]